MRAVARACRQAVRTPAGCIGAGILAALLLVPVLLLASTPRSAPSNPKTGAGVVDTATAGHRNARQFLVQRSDYVQARLKGRQPQESMLIVSIADNQFQLYSQRKCIRSGICATGSFVLLRTADGSQQWAFETPRGMLRVLHKEENPVWVMPDWAFVEEGRPIPSKHASERVQYGVLGDYALSLGQGYLIHGTLYQRSLGMPATHGCVRMGDDDLEAVYQALPVGARVYIY